jgi:sulfate adenylyltransferase
LSEGDERESLLARASKLPSLKITMRNLCDLELIATGGFSPLTTFMGKADYERVLHEDAPRRWDPLPASHHPDG